MTDYKVVVNDVDFFRSMLKIINDTYVDATVKLNIDGTLSLMGTDKLSAIRSVMNAEIKVDEETTFVLSPKDFLHITKDIHNELTFYGTKETLTVTNGTDIITWRLPDSSNVRLLKPVKWDSDKLNIDPQKLLLYINKIKRDDITEVTFLRKDDGNLYITWMDSAQVMKGEKLICEFSKPMNTMYGINLLKRVNGGSHYLTEIRLHNSYPILMRGANNNNVFEFYVAPLIKVYDK